MTDNVTNKVTNNVTNRWHTHTQPLPHRQSAQGSLPPKVYGALVGVVDGPLSGGNADHVFIPLRVTGADHPGLYQLAFNTESKDNSANQYCVRDEALTAGAAGLPPQGFTTDATLDYSALGLHQADFQVVQNGQLRSIVVDALQRSTLIAAYGFTYDTGNGLHDIHCNHGEPPGSGWQNYSGKDGALAIFYNTSANQPMRRWVFIKFATQTL